METSSPASMQLGDSGDGRSSLGTTRVANEVVAHIAALAALQVEGVHALYHPGAQPIDRFVRRPRRIEACAWSWPTARCVSICGS